MVLVRWKDAALEGSRKTGMLFRGLVDCVERKRPSVEGLVLEVMRLKLEEFVTGAAVVRRVWRRTGRRVGRRFIVEVRGCFPRYFEEGVRSEEYCGADVSVLSSRIKNEDNEVASLDDGAVTLLFIPSAGLIK